MFGLIVNVIGRPLNITDADGKRAVAFLPFKKTVFGKRLVNPFRRAAFDQLHRLCNGNRRRHRNQKMNVIVNAARRQQFDFILARNAADVWKQPRLQFRRHHRTAVFGAENAVIQRIDKRMRHYLIAAACPATDNTLTAQRFTVTKSFLSRQEQMLITQQFIIGKFIIGTLANNPTIYLPVPSGTTH
jgi:hypothetical protein